MKLGMPILVESESLKENIELAKQLGLDFIELNLYFPFCFPDNIDWISISENNEISFSAHLPDSLEIGELYEPLRKQNILIAKKLMDLLISKLNIKRFNIHIGRGEGFSLPDKKLLLFEKFETEYLKSVQSSLQELSDYATKKNIEICFENTTITSYTKKAFELLNNYSNLYYTLDIGHDMRNEELASRLFMKNHTKIKYMHIHDGNKDFDHRELGTGMIDIFKYIKFCKENNIDVLIEVKRKDELERSIKFLKSIR